MIFLVLTIAITSSLYLAFKSFSVFGINTLQAVVINYVVCVFTGIAFAGVDNFFSFLDSVGQWWPWALGMGLIFMGAFFLMAYVAQTVSVSASTVASKMSLVLPMLFSFFVLKSSVVEYSWIHYLGFAFAFVSIYLTTYKEDVKIDGSKKWILVAAVFVMTGVIDTSLNYTNSKYEIDSFQELFPIVVFGSAACFGILIMMARYVKLKEKVEVKSIVGGLYLGIPNYFSIYVLMKSLESYNNDGAFVFTVINICVIVVSSLMAILIFKEKLNKLNWVGIVFASVALVLLAQ